MKGRTLIGPQILMENLQEQFSHEPTRSSWPTTLLSIMLLLLPWLFVQNSKIRVTLLLHWGKFGLFIYLIITFGFLLIGSITLFYKALKLRNKKGKITTILLLLVIVLPYVVFSSLLFLMGMQI